MYSSTLILAIVVAVSLWVIVATSRLLAAIANGASQHRFFAHSHRRLCNDSGRCGVSLLCHNTNDDERLRNLLEVEYPAYEVIVVSDSLRNPDSLKRIISNYHMVAVDGGTSNQRQLPQIRRLYRSTSRCYRRLLLLDAVTTDGRSDLDIACHVATYDYLLALRGNEYLRSGAIERLVSEIYTAPHSDIQIITTRVGAPLTLISGHIANASASADAVLSTEYNIRHLYEPLAYIPNEGNHPGRIHIALMVFAITTSAIMAVSGVEPLSMGVIALSLLLIATMAYTATVLTMRNGEMSVRYGDILSLFCKNLLPGIWKIRK